MIAGTMRKKDSSSAAKNSFKMTVLTTRIKKRIRKKFKKTVSKRKIREVWKDYVDIMIIDPLIEKGKVQIDKHFSLEIVGTRIVDDIKLFNLLSQNREKDNNKLPSRRGICFQVKMIESRFKEGMLKFEPDARMAKRIKEAVQSTNKYYKIENVN